MNTKSRISISKQASLAFIISLTLFLVTHLITSSCISSPFCASLQSGQGLGPITTDKAPVSYDSRIFLLPLQHIMQILLRLIPFFEAGSLSAIFLTILFSSAISSLIILTAENAGLNPVLRWMLVAVYLSNPQIISATISGSGVSILAFFLLVVFAYLSNWQDRRFWLALVWIGIGSAFAVTAQFSALFFLLLPILAALIIAFRERPDNIYFTENAFWIMLTPLLYVLMIRFFFGYMLTGDPLAFYRFEIGAVQPAPIKQLINLPFSFRVMNLIAGQISFIYGSFPPFAILSAATIPLSIIKRKVFPLLFTIIMWIPLLILQSAKQAGIYNPISLTVFMAITSTIMIGINTSVQLKKTKASYLITICLLMLGWNAFGWYA